MPQPLAIVAQLRTRQGTPPSLPYVSSAFICSPEYRIAPNRSIVSQLILASSEFVKEISKHCLNFLRYPPRE